MLDELNERMRFDHVTGEYDDDSGRLFRNENSILYAKVKIPA
jgi:hypothetical protein